MPESNRLSRLRSAASDVKQSLAGTVERARDRVRGGDEQALGPDRGTRDQGEARRERVREEARQEKRRELRADKRADLRARERKAVDLGVEDAPGPVKRAAVSAARAAESVGGDAGGDDERGLLDRAADALEAVDERVDVDDDGVPLDDELQDPPGDMQAQLGQLQTAVANNEQELDRLERDLQLGQDGGGQSRQRSDAGSGTLEDMGIDPDEEVLL